MNLYIASNKAPSRDIEGAKVTIGTTAVELTFGGVTKSLIVTAADANTGLIYIGKSNVTSAGANAFTELSKGDSISIDFEDESVAVYAVSDTASQTIFKGALI